MQSPVMTYSPYYQGHDRVVSSELPLNDPLTAPSLTAQSLPSQAPSCSTPQQSLNPPLTVFETHHDRQTGDARNTSHIPTTEIPATFSGSSMVSYPHPLALKDPSCPHGKEQNGPLTAFVLHPETEAGSISDGKIHHGKERRGGKKPKMEMCSGALLSTDPSLDRPCNRVAIHTDDGGDGGENYDDGLNSTGHENGLYILVRYPLPLV